MVSKKKCSAKKKKSPLASAEEATAKSAVTSDRESEAGTEKATEELEVGATGEVQRATTVARQAKTPGAAAKPDDEGSSDSEKSVKKIYYGAKPEEKIFAPIEFGDEPLICQCPFCEEVVETKVRYVMGIAALLCCIITCATSLCGNFAGTAGGIVKGAQVAGRAAKCARCCRLCKCCLKCGKLCWKCCKCCYKCCKCLRKCLTCQCCGKCIRCARCKRCKDAFCQDVEHYCPNCDRVLGKKRIWKICND